MARFQVVVVDTRSGAVLDTLPHSGFSLKASVDWARHDSMSVTVPLTGVDARREQVTGIAYEPWKRTLCLLRNGRPVWAGPLITTRFGHDSVEFGCGGLTQLLDRRMIFLKVSDTLKITTGPVDAMVWLIYAAIDDGGAYSLPLDYGGLIGDLPKIERNWVGRDLPTVYESVKKVSDEDGAPDVRIDATMDVNLSQLTWRVRYGRPHLGRVDPVVAWDFPATITSLTGDLDGSALLTRGYVLGDGQDDSRLIVDSTNSLTGEGYPVLEAADRTAAATRDPMIVQSLADSFVKSNSVQASSWAVNVDPDYPGLDRWELGDNGKFRTDGHWFLPDGERIRRVTGYTLTDSTLALETMPPLTA